MAEFEIRHAHLFCGLGGGAAGFNQARPDIGTAQATFRCIGGIDVDAAAIRDFDPISGARGTVLDLFDRENPARLRLNLCGPSGEWHPPARGRPCSDGDSGWQTSR